AVRLLGRLALDAEPAVAAPAVTRLLALDPKLTLEALDRLLASPDSKLRSLAGEAPFPPPRGPAPRRPGRGPDHQHPRRPGPGGRPWGPGRAGGGAGGGPGGSPASR